MNIEHLRTFLDVAQTGSFHRSARRLSVTQSTVSARIKALETQLDRRLFHRYKRGIELTGAGRRLRPHAETAVRAWEQGRQRVGLPEELRTVFSLGLQPTLQDWLAPDWLTWMRAEAPDVAVYVEADYSDPLMRRLDAGLLDLAVMLAPRTRPNLAIETLYEEELVLVSAVPRTADLGWRRDYVFVDWSEAFRTFHSEAYPDMETPAVWISSPSVALAHIRRHGGAAYLSQGTVQPLLEDGRLHLVGDAPSFRRATYLAYPEAPANPAILELAIQGIRALADAG